MSEGMDDRLAALTQRFRDRATTDSEALERIAADLELGVQAAPLRGEIRRIAHSLSGAGAIFGFAGISGCAADLEAFVYDGPESSELAEACRVLVGEIRRTL
jgi:chemotaxis protein histidine kinase CheA